MRINWKDVFKFLSGAFFVTAGASDDSVIELQMHTGVSHG